MATDQLVEKPAFALGGPNEMLGRINAHDWASTPLGPRESWSPALSMIIDIMLSSGFPMALRWGSDFVLVYNDGYRAVLADKHPLALGLPFREAWPEVQERLGPLHRDILEGASQGVFSEDLPLRIQRRRDQWEEARFTVSYSPVPDPQAPSGVGGVLVVCVETTEAVHAQDRQRFQIELEDALRDLSDPKAVMETAARMIGEHLQVGRCGYGEVDASGEFFSVEHDWTNGKMTSLSGQLRLDDFGPPIVREFRAGRTVVLDDPMSDVRTEAQAAAYEQAGGMRAGIAAPLIKKGKFVAAFYAHQSTPRRWSDHEIALVEIIAERTWAAVERARAETALRESQEDLRASETQFRSLAQAMANHVWTATPDGLLDWFNDRVYEYSGARPGELDGAKWATIVHPEDLEGASARWGQSLASGETYETEFRIRRADGSHRWHIVRGVALRDESGAISSWVGTNTDIQDQKATAEALADLNASLEARVEERSRALMTTEEALRQAQKMEAIGQLTGGLAHDFNNLMTGVIGALALTRRRIASGRTEDIERFMDAATSSAERAAALTHRLLAFARRQSLDTKPQDLNELARGMEDMLRRTIGEATRLELDLAGGLWLAAADANQVESALLNLAINARDAMPQGGTVTISTLNEDVGAALAARHENAQAGEYVRLEVRDTGQGMTPEVLARVFEPFFTTKPIGEGTGLGLSMIYGFAKQSGGFVDIESAPGRGTAVRLYVPRAKAQAPVDDAAAVAEAPQGRGETILVVEDDPSVRLLITEVLGELGYKYLETGDARGALPIIDSPRGIDLLITDVGLPGMNGRQLAEIARRKRPGLKVLFVTGYAENAARRNEFLAPGMEMMTKPFDLNMLGSRINALIERRANS